MAFLARNVWTGNRSIRSGKIPDFQISVEEINTRLQFSFGWLKKAFYAAGSNGFSKGYHLLKGWMPAYPETTGYIITTLINYWHAFKDEEALQIAISAGDWLLKKQNPDGGIPAIGKIQGPSLAFDTGMVLDGFFNLFSTTGDEKYLIGARLCSEYLCSTQNSDGSWSNCYQGFPHSYHARIAWPLMAFGIGVKDSDAVQKAAKNLDWVVMQQLENGYWDKANFTRRIPYANTHALGYILEGLLESHQLAPNGKWFESARKAAVRLAEIGLSQNGYMPGYFRPDWKEARIVPFSFACLTGIAQISRAWLMLDGLAPGSGFGEAASAGLNYLVNFQDIETNWASVKGALPGSIPIYGGYLPLQYPNWAVKFLMDFLLLVKSKTETM